MRYTAVVGEGSTEGGRDRVVVCACDADTSARAGGGLLHAGNATVRTGTPFLRWNDQDFAPRTFTFDNQCLYIAIIEWSFRFEELLTALV